MPPHNLSEVIDATIFRIDNPKSDDLRFLKIMVEIRIKEIQNKS